MGLQTIQCKTSRCWSQQGFSLPEVLMAVGAMTFLTLGAMSIFQMQATNNLKLSKNAGIQSAKNAILLAFADDRAFQNTYNQNPTAFACLTNQNCTSANSAIPILYYDSAAPPLNPLHPVQWSADPANPSAGFDNRGVVCSTFDPVNGNDACPFRYNVTWSAMCDNTGSPTDSCAAPTILLTATLQYKPQTIAQTSPVNPKVFVLNYRRKSSNAAQALAAEACAMLNNGIMINGVCSTIQTAVNTPCGAPTYLVGYQGAGGTTGNCSATPINASTNCVLGEVITTGILATGQFTCGTAAPIATGGGPGGSVGGGGGGG